jgi:mono/diheme cytochrome c family protein
MRLAGVAGLIVVAGLATMIGLWQWGRWSNGIDAGDPKRVVVGRALYQAHCAECHGIDLKGEPDWRQRKSSGELPAPPHDETGHSWHHSDEHLFAMTKHGMARFAPPDYKSAMPSFVGKLSDDDIRSVLAFIKASWPPEIRERQAALNRH